MSTLLGVSHSILAVKGRLQSLSAGAGDAVAAAFFLSQSIAKGGGRGNFVPTRCRTHTSLRRCDGFEGNEDSLLSILLNTSFMSGIGIASTASIHG